MPRAGFGGGSDYSNLFSGLYSQNKQADQARQDASDQDAQDKWDHGLITDGEWMAYIAGRITAETDPKRKERWITAQREYAPAIADKQAEFAYSNGGSINDLIGHYNARLAALTPNSNEYRDVALKVNDLQDSRSSENLQKSADAMMEQINKGTKTYADLQTLLTTAREGSTANSDFRKAVDKQISQVKEQIRTNKLEGSFEKLQYQYDAGKLSGKSYSSQLRTMAVQFKNSDPKRYYQILEAATALSKSGGSGGSGGGSRGGGSSATKAAAKSIDTLQGQRNLLQSATTAYEAGATSYVNESGVKVPLTQSYIASVDKKLVDTFDQLATAYALKGDNSAAANQKKAKAVYIARNVVNHNTMGADDMSRHLLEATSASVQAALDNPDPVSARSALANVASDWETFATGLTKNRVETVQPGRAPSDARAVTTTDKGPMQQVETDFVARSQTVASAFRTLTTPGIDDAAAAAAMGAIGVLQGAGGGATDGGQGDSYLKALLGGVLEVGARVQGLETGNLDRVAVAGGWEWVRKTDISHMAPDPTNPSNMIMVKTKEPTGQTLSGKSLGVDATHDYVTILVDINGKPAKVQAIAERVDVAGFDHLKTKSDITLTSGQKIYAGTSLTESQVALISKDFPIKQWMDSGKVISAPAFAAWQVEVPSYTDKNGNSHPTETWSQDDGTKLWYKGALPIRGAQRDTNGFVKIDDNGNPEVDYKAFASAAGVPSPYAGTNISDAQNLLNGGAIDVSGVRGRDINGNLTNDHGSLENAYYDPTGGHGQATDVSSWSDMANRSQRSDKLVADQRQASFVDREAAAATAAGGARPGSVQDVGHAFAATYGIHLDGMPARPQFNVSAGKMADDLALPGGPSLNVPKVALSSGPTIALNLALPKIAQAAAVVVHKVTAPKVTIAKGGAGITVSAPAPIKTTTTSIKTPDEILLAQAAEQRNARGALQY